MSGNTSSAKALIETISDFNETAIAALRALNCTESNAVISVMEANRLNIGELEELLEAEE